MHFFKRPKKWAMAEDFGRGQKSSSIAHFGRWRIRICVLGDASFWHHVRQKHWFIHSIEKWKYWKLKQVKKSVSVEAIYFFTHQWEQCNFWGYVTEYSWKNRWRIKIFVYNLWIRYIKALFSAFFNKNRIFSEI